MADVFVSYSHIEKDKVLPIVNGLTDLGLTVWYDARIPTGTSFDEVIFSELQTAKAIIVCWSPASINSRWVRSEADFAQEHNKLVPCMIEKCSLRPPFNLTQAESLVNWTGSVQNRQWQKIVEKIGLLLGRPGLLDLLLAKAGDDPLAMVRWVRSYPEDPQAEPIWSSWKKAERERSSAEIAALRERLDASLKRRQSALRGVITNYEKAVTTWISQARTGASDERPALDATSDAIILAQAEETAVVLESQLHQEQVKLKEAERRIAELARERQELADRVDERAKKLEESNTKLELATRQAAESAAQTSSHITHLNLVRQVEIETAGNSRRRLAVIAAASLFAAAAIGVVAGRALSANQISAMQKAQEHSLAVAAQNLEQARNTIEQLDRENKITADRLAKQEEATRTPMGRTEFTSNSPSGSFSLSSASEATPQSPQAALQKTDERFCTESVGAREDRDNAARIFNRSPDRLGLTALDPIIQRCQSALRVAQRTEKPESWRRLQAQFGRAYVLKAVKEAEAGTTGAIKAARESMEKGKANLENAAERKSSFAMNLLADYYDGVFSRAVSSDPNKDVFEAVDAKTMFQQLKNAIADNDPFSKAKLAEVLLRPKNPPRADLETSEAMLSQAEAAGEPRAFIVRAEALLLGKLEKALTKAERELKAACLVAKAQGLDDDEGAQRVAKAYPDLQKSAKGSC